MAGQPELKDTLDSPGLRQLVQRVHLRFHIDELSRREVHEYIEHRLSVAGMKGTSLFAEDTYGMVYSYSGGIPRLINTLCDTALLCAYADQETSVTEGSIMSAIEELRWNDEESSTGRLRHLPRIVSNASERTHLTKIEVQSDGETLSEYFFGADRVIVGRARDNEIFIKSKYVSRHHAQIISDDSECAIEDLNSTNGIYVDDRRVKKYRLKDGVKINLGINQLIYTGLRQAENSDDSTATTKRA